MPIDADQDLPADMHATVTRIGAALTSPIGAIRVAASVAAVERMAAEARRERMALVALVPAAERDAAVAAGATQVEAWPADDPAIARVLTLAARHARRVREAATPDRRGDAGDPLPIWIEAQAWGAMALVMLAGLDVVNATYGRARGGQVIDAALARLRGAMTGIAAGARIDRLRGGEFLIAAAEMDRIDIAAIERIMAEPFVIDGETIRVTSRIAGGTREAGETARAVVERLRAAMARAPLPPSVAPALVDMLAVEIRRALEAGEIGVLFQPQVSLATGAIVGAEALARWMHPTRGEIGAETLFAVAERADLGLQLSAHVQARALAMAAAWPAALARLRLAINVTAADLARSGFVARLLDAIEASGFPRGRLTVEIVETGLIEDLDTAARLLATLRGTGCRVAIDDFGTGYSSLAYLKALPLDYLKIDRRLTVDIAGSERDRVVVSGVIAMARSLGLETIAEGVENERQRALLAEQGCSYYQGFLCAPPLDVAALATLMKETPLCAA